MTWDDYSSQTSCQHRQPARLDYATSTGPGSDVDLVRLSGLRILNFAVRTLCGILFTVTSHLTHHSFSKFNLRPRVADCVCGEEFLRLEVPRHRISTDFRLFGSIRPESRFCWECTYSSSSTLFRQLLPVTHSGLGGTIFCFAWHA